MAFVLDEAIVQLRTEGFNTFKKQTEAIGKSLSVISRQAMSVEKLSGSFAQQARGARSLAVAIGEVQAGFTKSTAASDAFFRKAEAGFRKVEASAKNPPRPSTLARQRQVAQARGSISNSYGAAAQSAGDTSKSFQGVFKNTGIEKLIKEIEALSRQLSRISGDARQVKNALGSVAPPRVQRQFASVNKSATGLNDNFKNVRYQTLHAGYALKHLQQPIKGVVQGFIDVGTSVAGGLGPIPLATSAASLAIVGLTRVLGSAVSQSADLEKSLAEVATISPAVAGNIGKFADTLGELSVATRTDVGLLSEGLYQAISSGITDVNDALSFVETSAKAARAGLTGVDVAVDGLSSVINAFGMQASDAGGIADKFFKTVEVGKLRFEDLARNIGKVAPVATTLGVSLDELLAAGAALTTGGNTLSASFTSLSGIMNAVLRPSQKAVRLAEELGIEFSVAALKSKGLTGFLRDLQMQVGDNEEVMGQLFGRVEGLKGIFALTGKQSEAFASNLESIGNATGATDRAVELMNNTLHGQIDLLKGQFGEVLRSIGNELLPSVTDALKDLNAAMQAVDWDGFVRKVSAATHVTAGFLSTVSGLAFTKGFENLTEGLTPGVDFGSSGLSPSQRALDPNRLLAGLQQRTAAHLGLSPAQAAQLGLGDTPLTAVPTAIQPVPTAASTPRVGRGIKLSEKEQERLSNAIAPVSTISPTLVNPSERRLPRVARTNLSGGGVQSRPFIAPTAQINLPAPVVTGSNIAAVTGSPTPGVVGELINPRTAIAMQDAAAKFSEALAPLEAFSAIGDTAAALRTPETLAAQRGRESLDALLQREQNQQRGIPVAVPGAFGSVAEDFGFDPSAGPGVGEMLAESGKQLAGSFDLVGSAIEGAAQGGLPGALIAVGTELVSMTEGFGRLQESWNRIVSQLVEAMEPVVGAIADALEPAFQALGEIVAAMEPYFKVLGAILKVTIVPAFKVLGTVVGTLAKGIQSVYNFIIKGINAVIGLINKIPGVDIKKIRGVNTAAPTIGQGVDIETAVGPSQARQTRAASGGIRIQQITGESRDILVSALRPLNNLVQLVSMNDTLLSIDKHLRAAIPVAGGGVMPIQPNLGGVDPAASVNLGGVGVGGSSVFQVTIQNINVDQVTDLNAEELTEQIERQLNLRGRERGGDIQINRNDNRRI